MEKTETQLNKQKTNKTKTKIKKNIMFRVIISKTKLGSDETRQTQILEKVKNKIS